MPLDSAERLHLDRQVTLARVVFAALALVDLVVVSRGRPETWSAGLLGFYLAAAVGALLYERTAEPSDFRISVIFDFLASVLFFAVSPVLSAWWFLYLFIVYALGAQDKMPAMRLFVAAGTIATFAGILLRGGQTAENFGLATLTAFGVAVSGLGLGYLASREPQELERRQFLEKVSGLLHFERGLTESIRQALGEIALSFGCEQACLAIRDEELERLFVWKVHPNEREPGGPETLALSRSETFLTDAFEISICWNFAANPSEGPGRGFGWDRRTGRAVRALSAPPAATQQEFGARSLMAVTIESAGRPAGRVLLVNPRPPRKQFTKDDLRWFEHVVRHVGPALENIFLMRHLRARAVESERSRMSRDLHDGILQTLLSLNIQLDVLRHKFPWTPEQAGAELATLQKTVQLESEELRRMVTELRPLRVESADMRELMAGFAERFRNESGLAVDLFIEDRDLRLPDRICRELFQIYRESLNNIKKHAKAGHVVVKLGQDEAKVSLVVDDNGQGFSFSGLYASEDLDRLRLGPISIKERTRSVGGTLTVESNPGHGARLTVEIPLN
jgi:signal transduction histidine kinase